MVSVLPAAARRVLVSLLAASSLSAVAASLVPPTAVSATAAGAVPPPARPGPQPGGDHLTVVVRHAGAGRDGTYEVFCHSSAGRHPDTAGACRVLDSNSRWGRDTFAPVAPGSTCTMLYGGPATAHVTGTWAGRPVDVRYDRSNGCEIDRWDEMVPLLPAPGGGSQPEVSTEITDTVKVPRRSRAAAGCGHGISFGFSWDSPLIRRHERDRCP